MALSRAWSATPEVRPLLSAQHGALPAVMAPRATHQALDLNDGSRITVARGARLDVLESSDRTVALALRAGRARFDVRPKGPRTWRVDCGVLSVEVVGTAFVVERDQGRVRVQVLRGAVLVRGAAVPDGVERLDAGQRFESSEPTASSLGPGAGAAATPTQPVVVDRPVAAVEEDAVRPAQPQTVAHPPERVEKPKTAHMLFQAADAARRAGRLGDAQTHLARVIAEYPHDPHGALAAFALARLSLGPLKDPARAALHLELALSLGLPAALRQDAHRKLIDAHHRAGNVSASCAALREYERRFPNGQTLPEADQRCGSQPPN